MTRRLLVLSGLLSCLSAACGGAVQSESSGATTSPEQKPSPAPSKASDAGLIRVNPCVSGGACENAVSCRPCTDRCDASCQELSCVQGTWRRSGGDPRPDPSCFDAGLPSSCPLPPVDTMSCVTSADCAIAFKGCWCGKRPVFGVSKTYAAAVQACEDETERNCLADCSREAGYSFDTGTTSNKQSLVAYCDTQPESGICRIQASN